MPKRSMELTINVTYGSGETEIVKVVKLDIPEYITKSKGKELKDNELQSHANYMKEWLLSAIRTKAYQDEKHTYYDW